MTDQITDQDRRMALAFAREIGNLVSPHTGAAAAGRVILATVDVPTSTLAEELMDWSHKVFLDEGGKQTMRDYSARAEQIEQERDYWKDYALDRQREVERLTAERDREKAISKGWMKSHQKLAEHHAETLECAVQKDAESTDLPDPTDVPAPRTIHTREELYELPRRTVIRDKDGVVCERASLGGGWYSPESTTDQGPFIALPATVLWEPQS